MTHASTQTRLSYGFAQSQGVILLPALKTVRSHAANIAMMPLSKP
tara:strand:+ start:433 stop:567 length:135 start_codon:yes stop_codon:yes gene_type:complete